ncbi:nitric oxide synthase-interacting protein homolog, partial [Anopheles stephensi]|uniref:nitric oxide synthase-interacting protein homolog n=1 Tax=Anopheles stephensi TaxID=30069 RepID=UPI001658B21C
MRVQLYHSLKTEPPDLLRAGMMYTDLPFTLDSSLVEKPSSSGAISNVSLGKRKELPSFWVPSQTPAAKVSRIEKPDSKIYCPVSNKPLKAKDLIEVKFTLVKDPADKKSLIAKEPIHVCGDARYPEHSVPCAVLKPT